MKQNAFKKTVTAVGAIAVSVMLVGAGCASPSSPAEKTGADLNNVPQNSAEQGQLKEFAMTSFYEMEDGKPHPQFSLNEIKVKKGDTVRIKVTNTKGNHDINIDEFGVKAETPLDQEVTVEFTADQAGQFVYYCSKPGHRQNGHWGTLVVEE